MKNELNLNADLVFSYLTLRKAVGFLGVALPFAVSLGALIVFRTGVQNSISSYYYTGTRDVLVGTLWAIGFFLLSYKGYERKDNIAGNLAFVFAIGIALFPTAPEANPSLVEKWVGAFHFIFAASFFITLIYFSIFLFTKTDQPQPTRQKLQRNQVYRACGYAMGLCILLIGVYSLLPGGAKAALGGLYPVFWLETFAILAFGISWLTKGEAILKDKFTA